MPSTALQRGQFGKNLIDLGQHARRIKMTGPDDPLRIDDGDGPTRKTAFGIEDTQPGAGLAVRIKIRQQRVTDTAQALGPDFEGGDGVAGQTEELGSLFSERLQRTVEGRGLVRSPAGKGQRVSRNDHPLIASELAQADFAAVVRLELEVRGDSADLRHAVLLVG